MRRFFGLAVVSLAAVAGCAQPAPSTRLAAVAPLPSPSLPAWISSVGPRSPAQSLAQIRVIFAKPVTPVESLEGDGPRDVLAHLRIDPALKGRFVVLTPRMIGFVADQALPVAARVRVTMTAGLRDLSGDSLDRDIAWTFETAPLAFSNVPGTTASGAPSPPPVSLMPSLSVDANTLVDPASLAAHARLHGSPGDVALRAHLVPTPSPPPGAYVPTDDFTKAQQRYTYELQPLTQLAKGTVYALTIDPGVEPAEGNVPTTKRFNGTVHTFDALRIVATPAPNALGAAPRFAGGDPAIVFNNPIDEKTIAGNVTVSPLPSPAPRIGAYASDGSTTDGVAIDPYALDPGRDYTVTIAPGLKDIFGQSFASAQIVAVHTGEFAPGMWAPSGTSIVPAASGVDLNVYATNLPDNRYRAAFVPVSPQQLIAGAYAESVLPSPAPSWPLQTLSGASVNRQSVVRISAQDRLHGPYGTLAYGFWAPIGGAEGTSSTGLLQITNLGVFAQWFPQHGIVLVSHLDDGSPAPRAHVDLYRISEAAGITPKPCASGTTDAVGGFDLGGTDLERCYISAAAGNAPSIGVVVREGSDVATLRTFNWSGIYAYDVMSGWASGAPLSRGVIFSDRQLYQPGERAQLTGIAYYVRGGAIVADPDASYRVKLTGPSGTAVRL
ncbi:MAG TPA: Ig-like domain-containing protein, partial [Candidatus Baltobacteraceae bacterium]|nr:Ig-like domain-containing protein [Candidatus Baltobacteraceae bacterium]